MKRTIICLVLCFLTILPLPVRATEMENMPYVVDQAGMLTAQDTIYLNNRAEEISSTHGVDVLIAIVEDMDGESAEDYAVSLNGSRYWWDTENAILFLLAMDEREWYIATFGTAISVFSDHMLDSLGYEAAESFSFGEYYEGFSAYLSEVEAHLLTCQSEGYAESYGNSLDSYSAYYEQEKKTLWSVLPVSLLIGIAVAGVSHLVMRSSMNTKRRQHSAGDYLKAGSYHLRTHQDIFLYSNVTKTRRQQNTGGSGVHRGGGSSVHRSSGGRSHGGRGGRF